MEQVRQFIDLVGQDQMSDAKSVFDELLSSQAFAKMEERKHDIASTMFSSEVTESRANDAFAELDNKKKL